MQKLFTLILIVLFSVITPLTAAAADCTSQITVTKVGAADLKLAEYFSGAIKNSTPVVKVINKTTDADQYYQLISYHGKTTSKYYSPAVKKPTVKTPVVKTPVVTPPVTTPPVVTPPVVTTPEPAAPSQFDAMQLEMLSYINAARSEAGEKALTLDKALCDGAYLKSQDMGVNNYFSHTSPTYGTPFAMMKSLGITYSIAGENIAMNFSVKGAHDAFMNSSGHRANILNSSFGKVGLGFYQKGNYLYVTQWFTN